MWINVFEHCCLHVVCVQLALDKFDTLTHQLTDLIVEHRAQGLVLLNEVVTIIFDKALSEQFFSSMYADLCVEVSKAVAPMSVALPLRAHAVCAPAAGSAPQAYVCTTRRALTAYATVILCVNPGCVPCIALHMCVQ